MKINEVITAVIENESPLDLWFRPVTWRNSGQAFALDYDKKRTVFVPNSMGGFPEMTKEVDDLIADWEIVDADTVLEERDKVKELFN